MLAGWTARGGGYQMRGQVDAVKVGDRQPHHRDQPAQDTQARVHRRDARLLLGRGVSCS